MQLILLARTNLFLLRLLPNSHIIQSQALDPNKSATPVIPHCNLSAHFIKSAISTHMTTVMWTHTPIPSGMLHFFYHSSFHILVYCFYCFCNYSMQSHAHSSLFINIMLQSLDRNLGPQAYRLDSSKPVVSTLFFQKLQSQPINPKIPSEAESQMVSFFRAA